MAGECRVRLGCGEGALPAHEAARRRGSLSALARETRPELTGLINNSNRQVNTSQNSKALYSLRAMLQYRPGASIPPGSMLSLI
jgi:hypothetical protein